MIRALVEKQEIIEKSDEMICSHIRWTVLPGLNMGNRRREIEGEEDD